MGHGPIVPWNIVVHVVELDWSVGPLGPGSNFMWTSSWVWIDFYTHYVKWLLFGCDLGTRLKHGSSRVQDYPWLFCS